MKTVTLGKNDERHAAVIDKYLVLREVVREGINGDAPGGGWRGQLLALHSPILERDIASLGVATSLTAKRDLLRSVLSDMIDEAIEADRARRIADTEGPPLVLQCQGCGEAMERVDDGCPFCTRCAAENAASKEPDEMRAQPGARRRS